MGARKIDPLENIPNRFTCIYCEGSQKHWGVECPACDGTGLDKVRKQLQKVYNAKNNLPLRYNVSTNPKND